MTERDRVRRDLEQLMVSGALAPGDALDEHALATRFDTKADVVREALAGLEREALVAPAGDGFEVSALDEGQLRDTYPIVLLLEGLAVRSGPAPSAETVARMREVNVRMRERADNPPAAAVLDHEFHSLLAEACGGNRLLATLRPLKRALLRYERSYMSDAGKVLRSTGEHDVICDALERGDREAAARALEENFRGALPVLLEQIRPGAQPG
jgi:DNA-binding GntR family transcriptional regulator